MYLHKKYCPHCRMVHFYLLKKEDIGRQRVCSCCLCLNRFVVKVKKLAECDTNDLIVRIRKNGRKIACEVELESFFRELKKCEKLM